MNFIPSECTARSLGPASQLTTLLIQTLVSSYCSISKTNMWPKDFGEKVKDGDSYDFIVIGAGTAGSVVASRLSEDPSVKVLVIEAGGDPPIESEVPGFMLYLQHSRVDWQYRARAKNACLSSENQMCNWPRGKMIGGSGAMNYMVYVRGNRQNFDKWKSLGNPGWGYDDVLPYFKKSEKNLNRQFANDEFYHSTSGPQKISLFPEDPFAPIFLKAAIEKGNQRIKDINADETLGYTYVQGFFYNGTRQSSAKSFLVPVKNRPNLNVVKNAHAYKILFDEKKRAIGVQYNYNGKKNVTVYANKEIIVSCGTIGSAQLLLLSGIGPQNQLEKLNIPTISNLRVGKKLYDHTSVLVFFKFKGTPPSPTETFDYAYDYLINRSGPLSSIGTPSLEGFVNIKNNSNWPDVQYPPLYFPQKSSALAEFLSTFSFDADIQNKLKGINEKSAVGVVYTALLQPKSVGKIRLKSSSYEDHPDIDANYFGDSEDMKKMIHALKYQASFVTTKSFKDHNGKFIKLPICGKFEYKSDAYWECYARHMTVTLYHPVGTCKMAPKRDPGSVVNSKLLVRGVKRLRVADLSIAPYIVSGNTNAAAIMIGEKAADMIKSAHELCPNC